MSERFIAAAPAPEAEELLKRYIDLAHPRLGTEVTYATDDFFADKSRMIQPEAPLFWPDRFDDHGKWMDGWESRRKRVPGHDFAVVKLGQRGRIAAVDIDTAFFTGNFPPEAMLEASDAIEEPKDHEWQVVVPKSPLKGNAHNLFETDASRPWRWLRLHIHPDGAGSRRRLFGKKAVI